MAVNTSQIEALLRPGLAKVTGKYKDWKRIYPEMFTTRKATMRVERTADTRRLGNAQIKAEGAPIFFDNSAGQRYVYNAEIYTVSLGYAITQEAIEDNLYKSQFMPSNLGLQKSFLQTKETLAATVFNLGNVFDPGVGGDGVALFSTSHPIDGGVVANTPSTQVELNEASLLNAQIAISSTFKDNAGLLTNIKARRLIIPPALEPVAVRLQKTALRPGTNDNDVNAIPIVAGGLTEYVVNPYFTSSLAWFVITDEEGLIHYDRIPFETNMWPDDTTTNLMVSARERYRFSHDNWRAAYGSFPTA